MNSGAKRDEIYLTVEFPRYDSPIIYADYEYQLSKALRSPTTTIARPPGAGVKDSGEDDDDDWSGWVWDPEAEIDNPCELKHRRLVRSHRNGPLDKELKPNAKIRDELHVSVGEVA